MGRARSHVDWSGYESPDEQKEERDRAGETSLTAHCRVQLAVASSERGLGEGPRRRAQISDAI
jgi:hypothetical protein